MYSCAVERQELEERLASIRLLIDQSHPAGQPTAISREIRGMAVLLLYAAYENLLTSVCRSLLEEAGRLRVGNRRLRPGLKLVAAYAKLQAVAGSSPTGIWKAGLDVVETLYDSQNCSLAPAVFPNDGTNFRRSQVLTVCRVFGLSSPAPILREVWGQIDGVVAQRNAIAHGRLTPGEIGRDYSYSDINGMIDVWDMRWHEFLEWVERAASTRDFFRLPR